MVLAICTAVSVACSAIATAHVDSVRKASATKLELPAAVNMIANPKLLLLVR